MDPGTSGRFSSPRFCATAQNENQLRSCEFSIVQRAPLTSALGQICHSVAGGPAGPTRDRTQRSLSARKWTLKLVSVGLAHATSGSCLFLPGELRPAAGTCTSFFCGKRASFCIGGASKKLPSITQNSSATPTQLIKKLKVYSRDFVPSLSLLWRCFFFCFFDLKNKIQTSSAIVKSAS